MKEKKCLGFCPIGEKQKAIVEALRVVGCKVFPAVSVADLKKAIELIEDNYQFFGLKKALWKKLDLPSKKNSRERVGVGNEREREKK